MTTRTIGPIMMLTLLTFSGQATATGRTSEAETVETAAVGSQARVVWGAAKQTTSQPQVVTLEMSPLQTVPSDSAVTSAMYTRYVGLQALDLVTTRAALRGGAVEANPIMRLVGAGGPGGIALKAATSFGVMYLIKKLSKKNSTVAKATMLALNAATASAVVTNLGNIR